MIEPTAQTRGFTFQIPPTADMVGVARRLVRDVIDGWALPRGRDLADVFTLVASELVTNAVRHAGSVTPVVSVEMALRDEGVLWIGVGDRGAWHVVSSGDTGPPRGVGGRGLLIVRELLGELGGRTGVVRLPDGGKTVWAEAPVGSPGRTGPVGGGAASATTVTEEPSPAPRPCPA